ncbi:redox-responsive ATPase YchF [Alphaproteobacteria bacterium]
MGFRCGIVGLPNVGKSTLFNALTSSAAAAAANYPFCTVEPNIGNIPVPDVRLKHLAVSERSEKIIPTKVEFVDIAGLVKGASQGEGLGNQFLGHIRNVDAIVYVLRCFDDDDIIHVEGRVDPVSDAKIIKLELALADIESLQRRLATWEKKAKYDKEIAKQLELTKKIIEAFNANANIQDIIRCESEKDVQALQLLSTKPFFYGCNVKERDVIYGNQYTEQIAKLAISEQTESIIISAKIESEIANLRDEDEKQLFLADIGLKQGGLEKIITCGYKTLGLSTFFTIGPKEARAWTIKQGTPAPQAAGVIHSDFEKGFICAEITSYEDYVVCGNMKQAKEAGKVRLEGRDYAIKEGDIVHFRFNV